MKKILHSLILATTIMGTAPGVQSSSEPFIGEIDWFAGNFAPRGWAFCNGQLLDIASNSALFSILGTTYGGDGRTNFALPDVRGRVLVHSGSSTGPGLSPRPLGQISGSETETLTIAQMPNHTHSLRASGGTANQSSPGGGVLAATGRTRVYDNTGTNTTMGAGSIANNGGGGAHNNMQPYNTLNCIIALVGIFPSRN